MLKLCPVIFNIGIPKCISYSLAMTYMTSLQGCMQVDIKDRKGTLHQNSGSGNEC